MAVKREALEALEKTLYLPKLDYKTLLTLQDQALSFLREVGD